MVYIIERLKGNEDFKEMSDALWWMVVTMTTVGYGDITPVTHFGRAIALLVMISGIGLTALFTAIVASYFVEKRILEGKGMEDIKYKKHIIVCGWNPRAMDIVEKILAQDSKKSPLVLINDLSEEHVSNILKSFEDLQVKYVRGDYVHEGVLGRANIAEAGVVVLLLDTHGRKLETRLDDRTVLAAFTIRDLNHQVRLCAEVENEDSIPHLRRAGVDAVVALGDHNDFLLANAAINPGVTMAVQEILTYDRGHLLQQRHFPESLIDQNFGEALLYFRKHEGSLLIGISREEEEGMGLEDILEGDMSAIDRFIKKKFEGLEQTYFTRRKRLIVDINPSDDYIIRSDDTALVIKHEEKSS